MKKNYQAFGAQSAGIRHARKGHSSSTCFAKPSSIFHSHSLTLCLVLQSGDIHNGSLSSQIYSAQRCDPCTERGTSSDQIEFLKNIASFAFVRVCVNEFNGYHCNSIKEDFGVFIPELNLNGHHIFKFLN